MAGKKLTRSEVVEVLGSQSIDSVLVGASRAKGRSLTHKQRKFAEAIAMGETKAGAYRAAYDTHSKPETQSHAGSRLMQDSRVAAQVAAFQVAAEAKRYATPAALRSLVIEQLTAMAVDDTVKHAQRLRALELLGKVTEVAAFTERREVVNVTSAGDARTRLLESLRQALQATSIDVTPEADLLAEIAGDAEPAMVDSSDPAPASEQPDDAPTGGAPPCSASGPPAT